MHRALTVPQTNNHMELFHNICSIRPTEAVFRWSNHFSETKNKEVLYWTPIAVIGYHSLYFESIYNGLCGKNQIRDQPVVQ